jgi:hypothetical protein
MQAYINAQSDVVVAFPIEPARRRAVQKVPDVLAPIDVPYRGCTVVPLRRGSAAKRAAVLLKVRALHADIEALTKCWAHPGALQVLQPLVQKDGSIS